MCTAGLEAARAAPPRHVRKAQHLFTLDLKEPQRQELTIRYPIRPVQFPDKQGAGGQRPLKTPRRWQHLVEPGVGVLLLLRTVPTSAQARLYSEQRQTQLKRQPQTGQL